MSQKKMITIEPDEQNDWINQGDKQFQEFLSIGNKKEKNSETIFLNYSLGLSTNRDSWSYNFQKVKLAQNIQTLINTYMGELENDVPLESVSRNSSEIKWSRSLVNRYKKGKEITFSSSEIVESLYRPFTFKNVYKEKSLVEVMGQMQQIFPEAKTKNKVICVSGVGSRNGFSALISNFVTDLNFFEGGVQCFPLFLFSDSGSASLFASEKDSKRSGISHGALQSFKRQFPEKEISGEDIFYYIYGIFHSTEYRERYKNNLSKELPRIPIIKSFERFLSFVNMGRRLGFLHANFNEVEEFKCNIKEGDLRLAHIEDPTSFFRVEKMKFAKKGDKSAVIYNKNITIENIPLEAYEYVVNGRPALEWVMDLQRVKTDKASGIVDDANDYANETMNNPAYPLELFQRVITVSLETMKIVKSLPKLDID